MTVGEFLARWLDDYAKHRTAPRTFSRYAEIVKLHLTPALGALRLRDLRPAHVADCYAKALDSGRRNGKGRLSSRTVRQHHAVLHKALEYAVRLQILTRNPADAVDAPKFARHEMQALTAEQVGLLLDAAAGTDYETLLLVEVQTGLREGELLGLRWQDLDFDAGMISVRQTLQKVPGQGLISREPKTPKSRRAVKLPRSVVEALRRHRTQQAEHRLRLGLSEPRPRLRAPARRPGDVRPTTARLRGAAQEGAGTQGAIP